MKTPRHDPVDHFRTTRPHAGETFTHGANGPGLGAAAVAVVALVMGLFALATEHLFLGCGAVILAVVLAAAGGAWVLRTHSKVRAAERRWHAENFDEPAPPPSS